MNEVDCSCTWEGCDEEGEPGCAYCRALDCEEPCPYDIDGEPELEEWLG